MPYVIGMILTKFISLSGFFKRMHPDKMDGKENAVILFAEVPQMKTTEETDEKPREMILGEYEETLKQLISDHREQEYDFFVAYHPEDQFMQLQRIVGRVEGFPQKGKNEGEKIHNAFTHFSEEYNKVIVINKAAADVTSTIVRSAIAALNKNKLVLKKHGGEYSLIGMNLEGISRPFNLFENIPWETDSVLNTTLKMLEMKMLSYQIVEDEKKKV